MQISLSCHPMYTPTQWKYLVPTILLTISWSVEPIFWDLKRNWNRKIIYCYCHLGLGAWLHLVAVGSNRTSCCEATGFNWVLQNEPISLNESISSGGHDFYTFHKQNSSINRESDVVTYCHVSVVKTYGNLKKQGEHRSLNSRVSISLCCVNGYFTLFHIHVNLVSVELESMKEHSNVYLITIAVAVELQEKEKFKF
jgi:hypothetical protein